MTDPKPYDQAYQGDIDKARHDLERFLQEDGKNAFSGKGDQAIWNEKPKTTGSDVNTLLDQAAPGLQWFERALIRYHRVYQVLGLEDFASIVVPPLQLGEEKVGGETIVTTGNPDAVMRSLEFKWYDQQRSMDLGNLTKLADSLTKASKTNDAHPSAEDATRDLNGVASAVPEVWQGVGGVAAQDHLAGFHAHAEQQTQYLQSVAAALQGLPGVLLQIVREKAGFISGFDSPQCPVAGHAMRLGSGEDPVSNIITVAAESTTFGYLLDKTNMRAAEQFHMTDVGVGSSDGSQKLRDACKQWLIEHFGPAVREAFTAFVHQCALADYYIRQAYKPVTDLLDNHDPTPFPKPQDKPAPSGPAPSPSPSGIPTRTTSFEPSTPPSTTPASVTPATPTPTSPTAPQANPLQALSGLVGQAGQTLQQGLGQLQGMVQQGLSGLATNAAAAESPIADMNGVKDSPGVGDPSASKTLASLDLPGGKLSLAQAPNGTLTATVTGPDGKSRQYSMGIKDGKPFFTENPDPSTEPTTAGAVKESGPLGRSLGVGIASGTSVDHPAAGASYSGTPSARTPQAAATPTSFTDPNSAVSTQSGAPMGGMPMGGGMPSGGASAGKGSPDPERRSSGIVPPQPLWTTPPATEESPFPAPGAPELASAGSLYAEPSAPIPPTPKDVPTQAVSETTPPPPRNDGVKIEIEMGK
ncbi:hypothetical protein [Nocardia sp. NPDC051570]|uniref:hypothetical protein n=1 Tax=Nocardia sp. NPDC051570 TaxID=3364324 RepID=UPI0037943340